MRCGKILGHRVDGNGLRPSEAHVDGIRSLTEPSWVVEPMRFLGSVNYFSDFVDHFSDIAATLYAALKRNPFNKKKRRGQSLVIHD